MEYHVLCTKSGMYITHPILRVKEGILTENLQSAALYASETDALGVISFLKQEWNGVQLEGQTLTPVPVKLEVNLVPS